MFQAESPNLCVYSYLLEHYRGVRISGTFGALNGSLANLQKGQAANRDLPCRIKRLNISFDYSYPILARLFIVSPSGKSSSITAAATTSAGSESILPLFSDDAKSSSNRGGVRRP